MKKSLFIFAFIFSIYQCSFGFYQKPEYSINVIDTFITTSHKMKLKASLRIPQTNKKLPCVIFLNGSGPVSKKEKIGVDILTGLASRGIASLVYNKRTYEYPMQNDTIYNSVTVFDEYVYDAIDALKFVQNISCIDSEKIFLIGHSQAAIILPYIYCESKIKIKGLVLLAATARNFEDLIYYQFKYLRSLDSTNKILKTQLEEFESKLPNLTKAYKGEKINYNALPLYLPASYWASLKQADIKNYLPKVDAPVLILHGNRDYQVPIEDFDSLKQITKEKENITYKSYDSLNHRFFSGKGKPGPMEYYFPRNVSEEVVDDIAKFIDPQK